jgi:long-chain acyl-CoA synthetase
VFAFESLLDNLERRGEAPAVIEVQGETLAVHSFSSIAKRSRALACGLRQAGLATGEPVGLWAPNGASWVIVRLGIAAAGGVAVAIDDLADVDEAEGIIRSSELRRMFTTAAHLDELDKKAGPFEGLERFVIDGAAADATSWSKLFVEDSPDSLPPLPADASAMLVFTSGTTSRPKPFVLRNRHVEVNVRAIGGLGLIGTDDRLLLPLPLHHVYPFVVGMLTPLSVGATVVFPEAASGPKIMRALSLAGVSTMIGVPRLYEAIIDGLEGQTRARGRLVGWLFERLLALSVAARKKFRLRLGRALFPQVHARLGPRLRLLISAGAKLAPEYIWKLEGLGFVALSGYGLAETASAFTGNVPEAQRIGSEGRPLLSDGKVRIADPDENGLGEIQLSGPSIFDGYIGNEEANRAAFTKDGWFRTGDLGSVDADGYVTVCGRLKELIVLGGGKNVFPEELEARYSADPAIRELAVLERQGGLVALVFPELNEIRRSANTGVEDVIRVALASVAKTLPSHERLSGFAVIKQPLPRTRLGKYRRFALPDLYEQTLSGGGSVEEKPLTDEDRALLEQPAAASAWKVLQSRYASRGISLDSDPQLDLGVDSLGWLSLGLELEAATGASLPEQSLAEVAQVRDLLRLVVERAGAATTAGEMAPAQIADDEARWLAPTSPAEDLAGSLLYGLNRLLARVFFRLRVEGLEHLPPEPPYVIVANHLSDLDPPLIGAALPLPAMRKLYWSGDRGRLFGSAFSRAFCRIAHIFPVDERAPGTTLAMAGRALERGNALIWFPESWRSPDGRLQRFLPGIGRLLNSHPVPAVPCVIRGTFEAMPRERRWPRPHPVRIVFGRPVDPAGVVPAEVTGSPEAAIAEGLRSEVAELMARTEGPTR